MTFLFLSPMFLSLMFLSLAWLAASAFYLACAHQRIWTRARGHARALRIGASLCTCAAALAAVAALGLWAGLFSALTALMLGLVALPYLDAWGLTTQARTDVG